MKKYLILLSCLICQLIAPKKAIAECNFKTGNYIDQLTVPNLIKNIEIKLNNSKKYAVNSYKIITSESPNIDDRYKKKFKAEVKVFFDFGSCTYEAKIWQNGDWKDHIKLIEGGQVIRSLNVKLKKGNIINATKFKLLIPETRNSQNEILGTIILKNLGFIVPETFEVKVSVNNTNSIMIFQEDSQKELLERNYRREGPIFEGDETIIWQSKKTDKNDGFIRDFETLSLSRLINSKWFLGGKSSQSITLKALSNLQEAYLKYASELTTNPLLEFYINPNNLEIDTFTDYSFLLISMNGLHGLRPHNRKYYFNSFINKFEPIYYDGNFYINYKFVDDDLIKIVKLNRFPHNYKFPFLSLLNEDSYINNVKEDFKSRIVNFDSESEEFFNNSIKSFLSNAYSIQEIIDEIKPKKFSDITNKKYRKSFLERNSLLKVEENIIKNITINNNLVSINLEDQTTLNTDIEKFSRIISRKKLDKEKYLYLPINNFFELEEELVKTVISELKTEIIHPKSVRILFDKNPQANKLTIFQAKQDQSILINGGELNNVNIFFKGYESSSETKKNMQRFNKRGLTGCLNIYNANIKNTSINVVNGKCEDSLNIVLSKGNINKINVSNAFQDAIDLDYSDLSIDEIKIDKSGNDCLDLSSGIYVLSNANLRNCNDKGISIGEKSYLKADNIYISNSTVGVAVKDFSKFINKKIQINNTSTCFQVFQKKQEFGGAYVDLKDSNCFLNYEVDKNSILKYKKI